MNKLMLIPHTAQHTYTLRISAILLEIKSIEILQQLSKFKKSQEIPNKNQYLANLKPISNSQCKGTYLKGYKGTKDCVAIKLTEKMY